MRTMTEIENEISIVAAETRLAYEKYSDLADRLRELHNELDNKILTYRAWRPMSDLKEYAGMELASIKLITEDENGSLEIEELVKDEILEITSDGHLYFSSFSDGIIHNKDGSNYYWHYYGMVDRMNFVGFVEVVLEED